MKRIYITILLSLLAACFVVLFVYSAIKFEESKVNSFWNKTNIIIMDYEKRALVQEYQIRSDISEFDYEINVTHIDSIDVYKLRNKIVKRNYVDNAWVYVGVDGSINIIVKQFDPILLVQLSMQKLMVDINGVSKVRNGVIYTNLPQITVERNNLNFKTFFKNSLKKDINDTEIIKIICKFANELYDDVLLENLIVQININKVGEVELIPRFGAKIITFCDLSDLEQSDVYISKLKKFYKKISELNLLQHYSSINLKFKDQVVAKKI